MSHSYPSDYYDSSDSYQPAVPNDDYYEFSDSYGSSESYVSYTSISALSWVLRQSHGIATFALNIILLSTLIGVLLWFLLSRARTTATRSTSAYFITAISLTILTLFVRFVAFLVGTDVSSFAYALFLVIFGFLQYLADALLLAAIFAYMVPRSVIATPPTQSTPVNVPTRLNASLCSLLIVMWLVMTVLQSAAVVQGFRGISMYVGAQWLGLVFNVLYLCAAIEILLLATFALRTSGQPNSIPSQNRQQWLLFLALVATPLVVRQIWESAWSFAYILKSRNGTEYDPEMIGAGVARQVFYVVCTTMVYAGLVLLLKNLSRKRFSERNAFGIAKDGGNGLELGTMGPETPVMRVPAPVEDPVWSRAAQDYPQGPIHY
ncbi:MAG: hypothetical protein Q9192_006663 [Flavoplaca navasiana]